MSLAFSNKVAFSSATDAALLQSEYIALVAEPNVAGQQAGRTCGRHGYRSGPRSRGPCGTNPGATTRQIDPTLDNMTQEPDRRTTLLCR
jgi:hypothetical protein